MVELGNVGPGGFGASLRKPLAGTVLFSAVEEPVLTHYRILDCGKPLVTRELPLGPVWPNGGDIVMMFGLEAE